MNYPIWEVPAGGLLIAGVAIVHVSLLWYLRAAERGGVPVREVLRTLDDGVPALVRSVLTGSASGQPITQRAAFITFVASLPLTFVEPAPHWVSCNPMACGLWPMA
jgi:hypothetical protein